MCVCLLRITSLCYALCCRAVRRLIKCNDRHALSGQGFPGALASLMRAIAWRKCQFQWRFAQVSKIRPTAASQGEEEKRKNCRRVRKHKDGQDYSGELPREKHGKRWRKRAMYVGNVEPEKARDGGEVFSSHRSSGSLLCRPSVMCACVHWGLQLAHQTHSSRGRSSTTPFSLSLSPPRRCSPEHRGAARKETGNL